jgi:hypothetical protein
VERRWRCVQHFLFSCKASPPACPDPTDLWLDLLDLLSGDAVAVARVRQALHVDSFNPADVRRFCMPWLLDPFCFLPACSRSLCAAVCSVLACYVRLVGASVADAAVPDGVRVYAAGLVHSCLSSLSLPPSSHVAKCCPPSFCPFGGAEAGAPLGEGVVPDLLSSFSFLSMLFQCRSSRYLQMCRSRYIVQYELQCTSSTKRDQFVLAGIIA